MKLNLTSLFFNASLQEGVGTPSWGTELGQGEGYKITVEGSADLILGMFNNKIIADNLETNFRGNKEVILAACFDSTYVNGRQTKAPFLLAVVEEHSDSHNGRKSLKYNDDFKYIHNGTSYSNLSFYQEVQSIFGENACWFGYEINIANNNELHLTAIKVSEEIATYADSKDRKTSWKKLIDEPTYPLPSDSVNIANQFLSHTKDANLKFTEILILRFIASLCSKPFVILTGLTGSGKTKLAQAFVQWICEDTSQYSIIPIGADWTNREPLLGYPNGLDHDEYILPDSGALQILVKSNNPENAHKPYFLILDEMNLSHVERYFADFLSVMESHKRIKLYDGNDRTANAITIDKEIAWPKNLFIIGTVNVDETTYMFSPKVLDRANVIEFRVIEDEMKEFLQNVPELNMKKLHTGENENNPGFGASLADDFMRLADSRAGSKMAVSALNDFFPILQKAGAEFGYRTASEINRLVGILETIAEGFPKSDDSDLTEKDFIDIAIMQKLLPKLHGSRNRLVPVLVALGRLCLDGIDEKYSEEKDKDGKQFISEFFEKEVSGDNILYKLSFDKIKRMYKNLIANGFTSYAEA